MKKKGVPGFFVLFIAFSFSLQAGELTLEEAYQRALRQSESVAIQEESIRIAEGHTLQALGTALPRLNLKATEVIQDTGGSGGGGSVASTFTRRSRPEVAVTLRQPLFQGFREFLALRVAGAEKQKNTLQTRRARQLLFSDVTRGFYTVIELEEEMKILGSIRTTAQNRNADLEARIRLGKSRESELLSAEAQIASLEAEIERTKGLVQNAREVVGFLIGGPVPERLADDFHVPEPVEPLETCLAAYESRPDLQASSEGVRLARGELSYEKGGRLPTVDLEANYYPYRVGFLNDIDWDLLFTFNVPIFRGGETRGKIQEAKATLKQSELARQEATRRAELEVRQAYNRLAASLSREAALRRAEAKAEAGFRAEDKDYRLGLINNLEVLQALRDWEESRLEMNRSRFESKLDYLQLKIATGESP